MGCDNVGEMCWWDVQVNVKVVGCVSCGVKGFRGIQRVICNYEVVGGMCVIRWDATVLGGCAWTGRWMCVSLWVLQG